MEEEIFDMISMHSEPFVNIPITHVRSLAKAITNHFREFIYWKDHNMIFNRNTGKYLYWEDHHTLDTAFKYWIDNIKEK